MQCLVWFDTDYFSLAFRFCYHQWLESYRNVSGLPDRGFTFWNWQTVILAMRSSPFFKFIQYFLSFPEIKYKMTKIPLFFSIVTCNVTAFKIHKPNESGGLFQHLQRTRHMSTLSFQKLPEMILYIYLTTSCLFPFLYIYNSKAIIKLKICVINTFYDSFELMTLCLFSSWAIIWIVLSNRCQYHPFYYALCPYLPWHTLVCKIWFARLIFQVLEKLVLTYLSLQCFFSQIWRLFKTLHGFERVICDTIIV